MHTIALRVATLLFVASQSLLLAFGIPTDGEAEGSACSWLGCESNGKSPVHCISGAVKLCSGSTVCYDIEGGAGNLYCGAPGAKTYVVVSPSGTPIQPVNNPTPARTNGNHGGDWNDKQIYKDVSVSYHVDAGSTSCGGRAEDAFAQSPFYAAIDPKFFGSGNPNLAPVCNQKIRLTYEGRSVELLAIDKCMGCPTIGPNGLDIAENAFVKLFGSTHRGRVNNGTSWSFI
ncbi:hypothetical protein NliqN6_3119 [Naganishia liquefaciens]|uniref:RlpA-like protein double-psi beta-barrel domain-containing protein n=1 Tax=Naganishia liquefaciens TaxID=104408 RepID=A0A8H3TT55_9TREE|nr:hypothetical protein NliqN6_3119 [Naganishia liquefaciens]